MAELFNKVSESDLDAKADKDHSHAHSALTDLNGDHHPQYLTGGRGDARYYTQSQIDAMLSGLSSGGGGVTDHGALEGRGDDDHPQYLTEGRGDARYYTQAQIDTTFMTVTAITTALAGKADSNHPHSLGDLTNVNLAGASDGQALVFDVDSGTFIPATINAGGVTDHGALTGKGDDDHPQYLTEGRADVRYYTQTQIDTGFYTQSEVDTAIANAVAAITPSRQFVTENYVASLEDIVQVDTDTAAITITAPSSPTEGAYFFVGDAGGSAATNNITVDFNGSNFDGADQDFVIDLDGFSSGFLFRGGEWELFG